MTRNDLFILALQTFCVRGDLQPSAVAKVLDEAAKLPVEALGEQPPALAAYQLYNWHAHEGARDKFKPKWLAEYEAATKDRVLVRVSQVNPCSQWWMHAERAAEDAAVGAAPVFPDTFKEIVFGREQAVTATRHDALLFRQWVESVPGYEEEPFEFFEAPEEKKA
jgi:hypothetical protein